MPREGWLLWLLCMLPLRLVLRLVIPSSPFRARFGSDVSDEDFGGEDDAFDNDGPFAQRDDPMVTVADQEALMKTK
eukprot:14162-Pyramimonas_sp.AAC.1